MFSVPSYNNRSSSQLNMVESASFLKYLTLDDSIRNRNSALYMLLTQGSDPEETPRRRSTRLKEKKEVPSKERVLTEVSEPDFMFYERFLNDRVGFGLFTNEFVERDTCILRYKGDLITEEEGHERDKRYYNEGHAHCYSYYFNSLNTAKLRRMFGRRESRIELCYDATDPKHGLARLMNHERANPTVRPKKEMWDDLPYIVFYANIDLKPGTQLVWDYNEKKIAGLEWMDESVLHL